MNFKAKKTSQSEESHTFLLFFSPKPSLSWTQVIYVTIPITSTVPQDSSTSQDSLLLHSSFQLACSPKTGLSFCSSFGCAVAILEQLVQYGSSFEHVFRVNIQKTTCSQGGGTKKTIYVILYFPISDLSWDSRRETKLTVPITMKNKLRF